jgi:hypothetical protein
MKQLFLFLVLINTSELFAQKEILRCQAISDNYRLEFYTINNINDIELYKCPYPAYIMDTHNYRIILETLRLMTSRSQEIATLKKNLNNYRDLHHEYDTLMAMQNKRVRLYKESYDQMSGINRQLGEEFDNIYALCRKKERKNKVHAFISGTCTGLLAGLIVWMIIP